MSFGAGSAGSSSQADIEVGAADRDLRYWLAKEAVRQGEARLTAQNGVRSGLEARAKALTGWGAVGFLAAAGASLTAKDGAAVHGAASAALVLFIAAALGIFAARPRGWSLIGYEPDKVAAMASRFTTELEVLESIGGGLKSGISINEECIRHSSSLLRLSGWLLLSAPIVGALAYRSQPFILW